MAVALVCDTVWDAGGAACNRVPARAQVATLDVVGVKHMLASLERKINKNLELRMKFPGEPAK